jgi:probable HAF family extracellular repeat protein
MKPARFATYTVAALATLSACSENPLSPGSALRSPTVATLSRAPTPRYTFTPLNVSGAAATIPSGINSNGEVVGWYTQGGVTRGFTYLDGAYTTNIVYPGAALTQLRGISPSGVIVGSYRNPGEPAGNAHGFVLTTDGTFIPVNYPGHTNHISQRILPDGTILGCLHDWDQMVTMRGVQITREAYAPNANTSATDGYSSIDAFGSMTNGGTPGGTMFTGLYTDMDSNLPRGFVIDHGTFTGFDVPGSDGTNAWDMNPAGTIVGLFADAATEHIHGFVLEHWRVVDGAVVGQYTTIDYPLSASTHAAYTDVFGINPQGDLVGKYRETSATSPAHGYIAIRQTD